MTKICIKCGSEKPYDEFSIHKTNKDGYNGKCKLCVNEYGRLYRLTNLDKERERAKNYYQENIENKKLYQEDNKVKIALRGKEYRINNRDTIRVKRKQYYNDNKDVIIAKATKYYNSRIERDPIFKLKKQVQLLIRDSFRVNDLTKKNRTTEIIGCTIEEFRLHLESQFEPWMNWDNKGLYNGELEYGWDIDHIIRSCSATCEKDVIRLNHYTNLQPLCSYINRDVKC